MITFSLLEEFNLVIDEIYAIYLDSTMGFSQIKKIIEDSQKKTMERLKVTQEHADNLPMIFGNGKPGEPGSIIVHQTTQKAFKLRNEKFGKNYITLGNLCAVQLYQYWEDYYRGQIAKSLSVKKNDILSDIFGDLRLMRLSILHHRAISIDDINRYKIFKWFNKGELIEFSTEQIDTIFFSSKQEVENLKQKYCA